MLKTKWTYPQEEGFLPPGQEAQCGQLHSIRLGVRGEDGKDTETQETWGKQ